MELNVLNELTALRGTSGDEGRVRKYIIEAIRPYADDIRVDRMGNVIALRKARLPFNGRKVMFDAHMDEVGFIVTHIKDDGTLGYDTVGGIDARCVVSKRVFVGEEGLPGVIGSKAIHLQTAADRNAPPSHDSLTIDIGAKDKDAAAAKVKPGDYVYFESAFRVFGDGLIRAKALDDRVGCYNLIRLMQGEYPCDVYCAFTVAEEIGMRGALTAARGPELDCAIALEGTSANDLGDVPETMRVCCLKKGVAVSFMDGSSLAHRGLFRRLRETAQEAGIPWQIKTRVAGGNDAGPLQRTAGGIPTVVLSVPCRYIHSQSCVAAPEDIDAQYQLADAFCKAGGTF